MWPIERRNPRIDTTVLPVISLLVRSSRLSGVRVTWPLLVDLALVAALALAAFGWMGRAAAQITEFSSGLTSGACLWAITMGPDGALWFTESNGNNIGRIATDGSIFEPPIPTPNSEPTGITAGPLVTGGGPLAALWFAELNAKQIGRKVPTSNNIAEFGPVHSFPSYIVGR